MKQVRVVLLSLLIVLLCSPFSAAQQSVATAANATVPPLIQFSNVATDQGGNSLSGVVSITFSLYAAQQGGEPLWTETQNNIQLDPTGHYSVQLGITKPNGVPTALFTSGEARWLGVRIAEQVEQARVLLLSVPYALKAGDAATIGGLPPSAFVLAAPSSSSTQAAPMDAGAALPSSAPPPTGTAVTGTGKVNFLPLWDTTSDIISSALFQSGTGATAKVGINTTTPATTLDVKGTGTIRGALSLPAISTATASKGSNSQPLNLVAAAYNGTTSVAANQTFQLQVEPAGNDTATPSGTLNLLFGAGTAKRTETGLHIASNGQITFATGQAFPGAGTITGITTASGSGLTGGGNSGTLSLGLLNTCASKQVLQWSGSSWACASAGTGTVTSVASGLGLKGGPITTSGSLTIDTTVVPQLGGANTFTGNQTVNGIFAASSSAFGVTGTATATSGLGIGVAGTAATPSGYGVEGINNAASGGVGVYGSSGAAAGYGVEGINTSGGGTGVYGTAGQFGVYGVATASSGSTVGVFGSGVDGLQGSGTVHGVYASGTGAGSVGVYGTSPGYGLYGVATNTTGTSFGVYGSGGSNGVYGIAPNFGLYGVATATSGNSVGVFGTGIDGLQGSGSAYGVYAAASASGSTGVYGTAPQFGIYGVATGSGNTVGVFGSGVDGLQGAGSSQGVYANGGTYGVHSFTSAGTAADYGVFQSGSLLGSEGPWDLPGCTSGFCAPYIVNRQAAVWADTNYDGDFAGTNSPALLATADANAAAVMINNSNASPSLLAYNYGSGGGSFIDVVRAGGAGGTCSITGGGDTACTGALKSVVATKNGADAQQVETYAVQSAENWFEDAGTAQLVNGAGRVNLESIFGQTVNTGVEYHVFLTPDGDCKGLYVSSKTASGFEVRELGGGASSIAFEYRIMAKRVGYENVRLANVTERFKQQLAQAKKMQRPARSSAEAQPAPKMPPPPSVAMQSAPQMLTPLALAPAELRPEPVPSKPVPLSPVRTAVKPLAAQSR